MNIYAGCLAPHVAPPRPDHMRLVWREVTREQDPPRVIEYTCACEDLVYELCREGGLAYIRRTEHRDGVVQRIHETYRWRCKEALSVWIALFDGRAH
ncbi:hypothetical protein GCM10022224_077620 [Nonomuraea antimicrobica]|uniref:Uncharacterized protein n=1 Tax=Nonomuraea antimicrobica TaxID=561173 RepID=A0ABP7D9F4_9ACTN